jgi:hypothetical protein
MPIYDPLARRIGPNGTVISTPFPDGKIPVSQINPTSLSILELIPEPNFGAPDATSRNFFRQIPRGLDADQFDVRVDHSFTTSDNAFVRFSQSNQTTPQPGTFDGFIAEATIFIAISASSSPPIRTCSHRLL